MQIEAKIMLAASAIADAAVFCGWSNEGGDAEQQEVQNCHSSIGGSRKVFTMLHGGSG